MTSDKMGNCGTCKFYEQGEKYSYCGNAQQDNEQLKEYAYIAFGCGLHKRGSAKSRLQYMRDQAQKELNRIDQLIINT